MDELYLDNIDEYVNDHNKIVTYKWLSLTLGVHVNTAKQMLFHYLDHKRKESSPQLNATYLVSGKFVDNGQTGHKVSIVKEDKLEDFKSKMSLVVSVHVYSVQKALLKDSGPLYSVDYDAVKDNMKNCSKYSAIHCASAVPMSSSELQQTRERAPSPEPAHRKPAANGDANVASKASAAKPQQKGIMGMFGNKTAPKKQDSGKDVKAEPKEEAPVVDANEGKPTAKVNPMANFFGSQAAKKPEKTVKKAEEPAPPPPPAEKRQSPKPEEKPKAAAVEPKKETKKDTKKDARSKTKRIVDSDSEDEMKEKKKRRRIKKPEPESSDEDVIPDSPQKMETREPTPSPERKVESPVSHSHDQDSSEVKMRKRRRVLKSRTFVDDEGCIVTEKGYESESYSETEEEVQAKKPAPKTAFPSKLQSSSKEETKKSQKKASANAKQGTKQASIMGFFQKK